MLEIIVYGFIWCFAIYGILVMIQEITRKSTYRKIEENVKLIFSFSNSLKIDSVSSVEFKSITTKLL